MLTPTLLLQETLSSTRELQLNDLITNYNRVVLIISCSDSRGIDIKTFYPQILNSFGYSRQFVLQGSNSVYYNVEAYCFNNVLKVTTLSASSGIGIRLYGYKL